MSHNRQKVTLDDHCCPSWPIDLRMNVTLTSLRPAFYLLILEYSASYETKAMYYNMAFDLKRTKQKTQLSLLCHIRTCLNLQLQNVFIIFLLKSLSNKWFIGLCTLKQIAIFKIHSHKLPKENLKKISIWNWWQPKIWESAIQKRSETVWATWRFCFSLH